LITHHDQERFKAANAMAPKLARKLEVAMKKTCAGSPTTATHDDNEDINRTIIDERATSPDEAQVRNPLQMNESTDVLSRMAMTRTWQTSLCPWNAPGRLLRQDWAQHDQSRPS
jgi:hypothetical protein